MDRGSTTLAQRLAVLECSGVPTWVFDPELAKVCWANDKALEFWRSPGRDELFSRDYSDMSEATRTRLRQHIDESSRGLSAEEQWTLYPRGTPVSVKLFFSGVDLDDGRRAVLVQAFSTDAVDPELARGIEAVRHTSIVVALVGERGEVLMTNPAAVRVLGPDRELDTWFADSSIAPELLRCASERRVLRREVELVAERRGGWYDLEARPVTDAVTGAPAVLVHLADQTARHEAERVVAVNDRVIAEQRREILALSAPLLDVGPGALAVPIVGALDEGRSAELSARLLSAVAARGATRVIVDLTGAEAIDATSGERLLQIVRAVRLLGARPVLTGVSPALARTLLDVGVELSGVLILRSLRDALRA